MSSNASGAGSSSVYNTTNLMFGNPPPKATLVPVLSPSEYDHVCLLTLEKFKNLADRNELAATGCGHLFSSVEIVETLTANPTCPDCGKEASPKDVAIVKLAAETLPAAPGGPSAQAKKLAPLQQLPPELRDEIVKSLVATNISGPLGPLVRYITTFKLADQGSVWNAVLRKHPIVATQILRNRQYDINLVPARIRQQFADPVVQIAVKSMHLNVRSELTTAKLTAVMTQFPYITELDVSGFRTGLNDAAIAEIARCLPNLRRLNLSQADGISDACVPHILALTQLEFLKIYGTTLSPAAKTRLQTRFGTNVVEV